MKAMILAAGRGERMRPLTEQTPKPLLVAGGKSLIAYHLHALSEAGIREVIINIAYLGKKIIAALGDGRAFNLKITYSDEGETPLETAGGIIHALPGLGNEPFLLVNADIWTDFPFQSLHRRLGGLAHLVMVDNPDHHPQGDFALVDGVLHAEGARKLTYSGIGLYHPALFAGYPPGKRPLLPLLQNAMREGKVSGQHYSGRWLDIGTPGRLNTLNALLATRPSGS